MAVMLNHSRLFYRIPRWVHLSAYFSSTSSANCIEIIPEIDQTPLNSSEFESKIQFLKSKLQPETLICALASTTDLGSSLKLFKWASLQKQFQHTAGTFHEIILKLGMAGNIDEMEGFCYELVKERCPGSEKTLLALIDSFVKHSKLDEALRVLKILISARYKPSIALINLLLGALIREKKGFHDVLFVYKEMVKAGIFPTVDTLNLLLEALFDADRIETALDQYRRIGKKGHCPNSRSFEILVTGLITRNHVDESIIVLDEMLESGCEIEFNFYASVIPLYCRKNKQEVGMKLFKNMRASNIVPDSLTYEVLIRYLSENLLMDDAMNLLDEMIDLKITPPDGVFGDIINGFCILGNLAEAKFFLENRQVTGTNCYNALLEGYCKAGNFLEAKSLFNEMVERNTFDSNSWNILIRSFSENERVDKALQVFEKMIVSSYAPDPATYSALIVGHCKANALEDAMELFCKIRNECWVLDYKSYATLVESLCHKGKIQEAVEVFRYMSTHRCMLQSSSFNLLIKGLSEIGRINEAIMLLPLAYYSGTSCSNPIYNTIMLVLSKLNKETSLLVVLSRMVVEGCHLDVDGYCILVRSMASLGRTKDSVLFLKLMIRDGFLPDLETLENLVSCLAKNSQLHMMSTILDKLVSENEILNASIFNILINGLWKEGYRNEAGRLLDVMLEKGWVPDASTHGLLIGSGEVEESEMTPNEKGNMRDEVSSILSEEFGESLDSI